MFLIFFACTSPEKAATEHLDALCTYLSDCDILISFGYEDLVQCTQDTVIIENDVKLLKECTESLQNADCSNVYNEDLYLTEECTTWSNSNTAAQ